MTTRQLPLRMLPGIWVRTASVRPATFRPLTVPLSMCHARTPSQVPPSGSSPTQHGQSTLQVQTSNSCPSSWYAIFPSSYRLHLGLADPDVDPLGPQLHPLPLPLGAREDLRDDRQVPGPDGSRGRPPPWRASGGGAGHEGTRA